MNTLIYILFHVVLFCLRLFPYEAQVTFLTWVARLAFLVRPRYKKACEKNLALVFPDKAEEERAAIVTGTCEKLARLVADFVRLPSLDRQWFESRADQSFVAEMKRLREDSGGKGLIIVAGHFNSFELLPFFIAYGHRQFSYVVRTFKHAGINRWWNDVRESCGISTIKREGAVKSIVKKLRAKEDVGFLFDQNLVRTNAVFVPWFGRLAATTKVLGYSALKFESPVILVWLSDCHDGQYEVQYHAFDFREIYSDPKMDKADKVLKITTEVTEAFEKAIVDDPPGWFWMHRRWKTSMDPSIPEDFYED